MAMLWWEMFGRKNSLKFGIVSCYNIIEKLLLKKDVRDLSYAKLVVFRDTHMASMEIDQSNETAEGYDPGT
ncbi:MAG: hypothetical protein SynsKO_43050 [Synoicihabitans sp.]